MKTVRFRILAQANAGLLCRMIGLFAQLDLPAPALRVSIARGSMDVEASLAHFGDSLASTIARKMAGFVGVERVAFELDQAEARPEPARC